MKYDELNIFLKSIIRDLLSKYAKSHIIAMTLGSTSANMFNKFVEEDDAMVGIRPLIRVLDNLGYDLELVPVPKNDNETKKLIDVICRENFIEHVYEIMVNALESGNFDDSSKSKSGITGHISDLAKKIVEQL